MYRKVVYYVCVNVLFCFRFNQDYLVYLNWNPERLNPSQMEKDMELLSQQETLNLKLRTNILYAFDIGIKIAKSSDGVRQQLVQDLSQCLDEWECLYTNISSEIKTPISQVSSV